jgi:hypothetical protein
MYRASVTNTFVESKLGIIITKLIYARPQIVAFLIAGHNYYDSMNIIISLTMPKLSHFPDNLIFKD